ncbi:MAG: TIGR02265 family protein [Blastocatellia bacterium]
MEIKGSILTSRIEYVKERFGDRSVEAVLNSLPNGDQALLRNEINPAGWYHFQTGQRLDAAIVQVIGRGNAKLFEEMGASSAEQSLSGIQRFYLDPGNPQGFMLRAPLIYHVYYDKGWRDYWATGPSSGVMTTFQAETYSAEDCLTVIGWYKQALKMCGAQDVEIIEDTCRALGGEFCRYLLRWK